jgi:Flp pilus assembly protein TadG
MRRPAHGQATLEFALALPVMLLIVIGAVDVGRVFFDYVGLRNAAMEGAIYGARNVNATEAQIKDRVKQHFPASARPADGAIVVDYLPNVATCTTPGGEAFVTVRVTKEFRPISLQLLQFLGPGTNWVFTVQPTAKARCMT